MFVYKKNPVGIELFSHVKTFFYSKQFVKLLTTRVKTIYREVARFGFWAHVNVQPSRRRIKVMSKVWAPTLLPCNLLNY